MAKEFDQNKADSQATAIEPVTPDAFDFAAYKAYEDGLLDKCKSFWDSDSCVLVYRRMRVAEVFSYGCRDMKNSLALQLGGLQKSMDYPADIPNFLEPWYGIGTVASSFGIDYVWHDGQSPAFKPKFKSIQDALDAPFVDVKETAIGQYTLKTIDYFLEQTQGRIPMSLCDVQSPFNVAAEVVDITALLMALYDCPDKVVELLDRIGVLLTEFTHEQVKRISDALVWPGHGFASSRVFEGFGMADDNSIMLSADQYQQFSASSLVKTAEDFAGPAFHSCGNWSHLAPVVKQITGLRMADGAFGAQTDPFPNDAEVFGEVFADSGIIVNARIVGDSSEVVRQVRKLWAPGMKLIATTYCQSPEDQQRAYEMVHEVCQ